MTESKINNEHRGSLPVSGGGLANTEGVAAPGYVKPVLLAYGDVRDVTLGPTPGLGESGCECARRDGASAICPVVCPPGV